MLYWADDPKATGNPIKLLINTKTPIRGLEYAAITVAYLNEVVE
jgi:hypothetical protein